MTWPAETLAAPCPCGRAASLAACCHRYLSGTLPAPDPESLMRSRYAAFVAGTNDAVEYLVATHHPNHRGPNLGADLRVSVAGVDAWENLDVLDSSVEGDSGLVEFVATYRAGGKRRTLRERSSFVREGGLWYYTVGAIGTR